MKKPSPRNKKHIIALTAIMALVLIFSSGCQLRSKKSIVISRLQKTAKLATQEVTLSKYIFFNDDKIILRRIREKPTILIYTEAYIKYGVDLQKIGANDVALEGDIIRVKLPPVEELNFSMPTENARLMDIDVKDWSTSRKNDPELIDELLQQAHREIKSTAEYLNLPKAAEDRTRTFITTFLENLGFGAVIIEFKTEREQKKDEKEQNESENL